MEEYVALLRGINVGGKRKILMSDLKSVFELEGFTHVQTYIQSGNIVFWYDGGAASVDIEHKLERLLIDSFGFEVIVIVRSGKEFESIINCNPYKNPEFDNSKLHLTFLKKKPEKENIQILENYDKGQDACEVIDKHVFIECEGKYHESKLANNILEKKLNVIATTRNWKTVNSLSLKSI